MRPNNDGRGKVLMLKSSVKTVGLVAVSGIVALPRTVARPCTSASSTTTASRAMQPSTPSHPHRRDYRHRALSRRDGNPGLAPSSRESSRALRSRATVLVDDVYRLHLRRRRAHAGEWRRSRDAPRHEHRRLRRHAWGHAFRPRSHAGVLRGNPQVGRTVRQDTLRCAAAFCAAARAGARLTARTSSLRSPSTCIR